ncbi:pertactin-like passenger domain-containing protein, partial [Rodentibacter myodis]|uniref:pertactin-like passenger domain-containing protein n=1 Tax=Rodentibacter myodis TaxID=1907939 RepID=UPI00117B5009
MKNNEKFNRTFKISLIAAALGLANQAWAAEVQCNTATGVSINNQNGATLNNCVITQPLQKEYYLTKINVTNSQDVSINHSKISISGDEWSGIRVKDASATLNNVELSASNPTRGSSIGIEMTNSTVNINGGKYTTTSNRNTLEAFRLINSTLNAKNVQISLNGIANDGISLEENSTANLENVTLTATNEASPIIYDASNNSNSVVKITNSKINSHFELLDVRWDVQNDTVGKLAITVDNSSLQAPIFLLAGSDKYLENGHTVKLNEHHSLTAKNSSTLNGLIAVDNDEESTISLNLDHSSWTTNSLSFEDEDNTTVTITPSVTNLDLNNGVVTLEKNDNFQTLTIFNNLTGSGTFNLNTNIAENKGDKIIVQGSAEGNHKIGVTNQGANVANRKLTLVETKGGNGAFSLTNPNNRVDLGAYQYFLTKEGNNWVLADSQSAVNPETPAQPTPNTPSTPST